MKILDLCMPGYEIYSTIPWLYLSGFFTNGKEGCWWFGILHRLVQLLQPKHNLHTIWSEHGPILGKISCWKCKSESDITSGKGTATEPQPAHNMVITWSDPGKISGWKWKWKFGLDKTSERDIESENKTATEKLPAHDMVWTWSNPILKVTVNVWFRLKSVCDI